MHASDSYIKACFISCTLPSPEKNKTKQNIKSKEIGSNSKAERENESGGKARDTIEFVCSWILWWISLIIFKVIYLVAVRN